MLVYQGITYAVLWYAKTDINLFLTKWKGASCVAIGLKSLFQLPIKNIDQPLTGSISGNRSEHNVMSTFKTASIKLNNNRSVFLHEFKRAQNIEKEYAWCFPHFCYQPD